MDDLVAIKEPKESCRPDSDGSEAVRARMSILWPRNEDDQKELSSKVINRMMHM